MATDPKSQDPWPNFRDICPPQHPWSGSLSKNRHQTRKQVKQDVSVLTVPRQTPRQRLPVLPCHVGDPDLWFADTPAGLEVAKTLCVSCPIRRQCLAAALQRAEPWGVWGGEIFDQGSIVSHKRPRGRPRKDAEIGRAHV